MERIKLSRRTNLLNILQRQPFLFSRVGGLVWIRTFGPYPQYGPNRFFGLVSILKVTFKDKIRRQGKERKGKGTY